MTKRARGGCANDDHDARPDGTGMSELQREAQRKALALIKAKQPVNRIDYALFYLQTAVGLFLIGRDTKDDLAWHHEVAQELANLTDDEIAAAPNHTRTQPMSNTDTGDGQES